MRIGYFTNTYPRATDTFIQREIKGLRERGFDVRTFSVRKSGADHDVSPEVIAEKRNTFYVLPVNPVRLLLLNLASLFSAPARYLSTLNLARTTAQPGCRGMLWQMFYFQEAVVLAAELRRQQIEHLHNHLGDASATVALLASKLSNIGYSNSVHGSDIFFDPTHWALREKVRHSRFTVCISNYCRSQMMLFTDSQDWQRLAIVHCGVSLADYEFTGLRDAARKLLYVGRLAAEKGLPVLFESLGAMRAQQYEFELTLLGDGPDREKLEALARQHGIADRVMFAGYASPNVVAEHLRRTDIFVLPSFFEGVPVSLMEAMACGVPVIATYVGGVAELVQDGETGQVVYPGDPVSLKNAIVSYLDDFALRERVSRQGREKVAADFNLDREIDKLAGLFREHAPGTPA
jgi:glycosyltransferase involved in cell wall biosynthesis